MLYRREQEKAAGITAEDLMAPARTITPEESAERAVRLGHEIIGEVAVRAARRGGITYPLRDVPPSPPAVLTAPLSPAEPARAAPWRRRSARQ
ncbi:MAG: hypothetical protein ACLP8X_05390 [Streptosporangiaceae bacterium]